jgi:hypothetical protein
MLNSGFGPKVLGMEAPGKFQRVEVRCVDLIQRRVFRISKVSTVCAPLAVLRSGLRRQWQNREQENNPRKYCSLIHVFPRH